MVRKNILDGLGVGHGDVQMWRAGCQEMELVQTSRRSFGGAASANVQKLTDLGRRAAKAPDWLAPTTDCSTSSSYQRARYRQT